MNESGYVSNPNGVNLHSQRELCIYNSRFVSNPNGVNLHLEWDKASDYIYSFKPQRGKFTRSTDLRYREAWPEVSNPNGVNLHAARRRKRSKGKLVSNPNGVNLH